MDIEIKAISKEINLLLWKNDETLSTAESCTGGMISSAITTFPGSSHFFKCGVISYTNEIKINVLGVRQETIDKYTEVSEQTAREMVEGVRRLMDTTYGVAVTGFAGPGGGTAENPVGTIWIAVGDQYDVIVRKLEDNDGREKNMARAAAVALTMLKELLISRQKED
jgi:nicotinamide-nucleotide amidase